MLLFEQLRRSHISARGIDMKKTYNTIAFDIVHCTKDETETIFCVCVFLILWNSKIYQAKREKVLMLIGL
jgi:hypothetical protein